MAAEKKTATPTEYLVLKRDITEDSAKSVKWVVVAASVMATSASAAIRQVAANLNAISQAGVYVAIPTRSWKPTNVAPQTQIRLELTEAKA